MSQAHQETLELLLEAGCLLSSKLDLGELLRSVLQLASRVVGAETASLLLLDERAGELYFDVALGLGEEASRIRLPLGEGIAGSVAQSRQSAIINDAPKDPRWSPKIDQQSGFATRSILAVPMSIKGHVVGVLEAINKKDGGFSAEDLRAFEAFASQAAVAIENARLFSSLKEEKFKLDTVFSQMKDGAILADASGRILIANTAAKQLLAVGGEHETVSAALAGMTVSPSLEEMLRDDAACREFSAVRENPKKLVLTGAATRVRIDGNDRTAPLGWLCVFRDGTEEWQKERLKRSFLSLISHKLKTPLSAVTGFADVLLEEFSATPPPPIQLKAAQTIAVQGKKLAGLVEKLLRYTTLENSETASQSILCPIDDIVSDALKDLKPWLEENTAQISYQLSPDLCIMADKNQMGEVIKNLIENSVKFDEKMTKIVSIWTEASPTQVIVRIKDAGPGIPPEDQEKIFSQFHQIEAFFTGQVEGWGLGLPFVKKVVETHGGRVEMKSRLGEGTVVSLVLPRAARAQAPAAKP